MNKAYLFLCTIFLFFSCSEEKIKESLSNNASSIEDSSKHENVNQTKNETTEAVVSNNYNTNNISNLNDSAMTESDRMGERSQNS